MQEGFEAEFSTYFWPLMNADQQLIKNISSFESVFFPSRHPHGMVQLSPTSPGRSQCPPAGSARRPRDEQRRFTTTVSADNKNGDRKPKWRSHRSRTLNRGLA